MSEKENKEYGLAILKKAGEISYEKPERTNSFVQSSDYEKIDNAMADGVVLTDAGTTLVAENQLHEMLGESKKDTKYIVDNKIPDSKKVNIDNEKYIKSGAIIEETHTRAEEHPDAVKRAKNRYTEESLINISKSADVKSQKGDFESFAKKEERKLLQKRKRDENITHDEITGQPLDGNGEFHHTRKKSLHPDPVNRLNPRKGVLVNRETHQEIHKNNINDEAQLEEYRKKKQK